MSEQEVNFRSKGAELAGTLSHPDSGGPFPALLLLPGSGQTERNDNVKQFPINAVNSGRKCLTFSGVNVSPQH